MFNPLERIFGRFKRNRRLSESIEMVGFSLYHPRNVEYLHPQIKNVMKKNLQLLFRFKDSALSYSLIALKKTTVLSVGRPESLV